MEKDTKKKQTYVPTPAEKKVWIKQEKTVNAGLIGIGVVIIQPFLSSPSSLESMAAKTCVVSFAIAIPLLTALLLLNFEEAFRNQINRSAFVEVIRVIGQLAAVVGVAAGFWHIHKYAGIAMVIASIIGLAACAVGYKRLYKV